MGGTGSGGHNWKYSLIEYAQSVKIKDFGNIKDKSKATISYSIDGKAYEVAVLIKHVQVPIAGHKSYFVCPNCGNNFLKLYLKHRRIACRKCQGLTYSSTQRTKTVYTQFHYKRRKLEKMVSEKRLQYEYAGKPTRRGKALKKGSNQVIHAEKIMLCKSLLEIRKLELGILKRSLNYEY
jgi:hypothetical protein